MKFRSVGILAVALVLSVTSMASAELIVTMGLQYVDSTTADWASTAVLPTEVTTVGGAKTTKVLMASDNLYVNHRFNLYITVSGLLADQDLVGWMVNKAVTGAADSVNGDYVASNAAVDPPSMGSPASNAPSAVPFAVDNFNGTSWQLSLTRGAASGSGGNKYGDYASYMHVGEGTTPGIGEAFFLGEQNITAAADGSLTFAFKASNSVFKIISGNAAGMAAGVSAESYPALSSWTGIGDTAQFEVQVVPEPSTLALLASGLFGLVAYAWRRRK